MASYSEVFAPSQIELLYDGITEELRNLGDFALGDGANTLGKALQSLGGALSAAGNPRAEAYGEVLENVGLALETGSSAYLEGISLESAAKIGTDIGVGTLAGVTLFEVAGFIGAISAEFLQLGIVWQLGLFLGSPIGMAMMVGLIAGFLYAYNEELVAPLSDAIFDQLVSPLLQFLRDPLILDLDGDGVELSSLTDSNVHFDYDRDGFAEKTGWISADDGILVIDANSNGSVDDAGELFGSPSQDGFAVLETLDSNRDGKIDAEDDAFTQLRVWRDLDQDGVSDEGELMTLEEAGVTSISLVRTDVTGTNSGHDIGFEAEFTRTDGTSGTAQTIYFATDRQDTRADNTPDFVIADGVAMLPQLPGSGQINSLAWKATEDSEFREDWTALTDQAATLTPVELRSSFKSLLLRWASVDSLDENSRGEYVNAQHLAFVEHFFGTVYKEVRRGQHSSTSPSRDTAGAAIEASFEEIVDVLLTAFLSQVGRSVIVRGGELDAVVSSPYFAYAILDFSEPGETATPADRNVPQVVDLITRMLPPEEGAAAEFLMRALGGLEGMATTAFGGDRGRYWAAVESSMTQVTDAVLQQIATSIVKGGAAFGSSDDDGLLQLEGDNLFDGGHGDDVLVSGAGSDIFIYRQGDGSDVIRDISKSVDEQDILVLTDLNLTDLTFERIGDTLRIRIASTNETIVSEDFFRSWGHENRGIDKIRLADGSEVSREQIARLSTMLGNDNANALTDTESDDILRGDGGDDQITISGGSDTVIYAVGDGYDVITDTSGLETETDILKLLGLRPEDIELSRVGSDLVILVRSSGEQVTSTNFFRTDSATGTIGRWGIDQIKFENGVAWDKATITSHAWIRGDSSANSLSGDSTDNILFGGAGNDTLEGGMGSDTYVWKVGDGSDTIVEGQTTETPKTDRLVLQDLRSGDVEFFRRGTSLVIRVKATGEAIEVSNQFYGIDNIQEDWDATRFGLEQIEFSDGSRWGRDRFMKAIVNVGLDLDITGVVIDGMPLDYHFTDEFGRVGDLYDFREGVYARSFPYGIDDIAYGTEGDDLYLFTERLGVDRPGNEGHNLYDGRGGNDVLVGGDGHDALIGGEGSDTLYGDGESESGNSGSGYDSLDGGYGDDRLYGGGGDDSLSGGEGNDLLSGGDGADTLVESRNGNDTFIGGRGDDLIVSGSVLDSGSDVFVYARGDGNDVIVEGSSSTVETDILRFVDINANEVELSRVGSDLLIRISSTGETIYNAGFFNASNTLSSSIGIDRIVFADGSIWDRGAVWEKAWFRGTNGRDVIETRSVVDNTIHGGRGDDILISAIFGTTENGSDTFVYASGDGNDRIEDGGLYAHEVDRLRLTDLNSSNVQLSRLGGDMLIRDLLTGHVITAAGVFASTTNAFGIDEIVFADGERWDRIRMHSESWFRGSLGRDYLETSDRGDNTFVGGLGDDTLVSATTSNNGSDTYIYNLGDGNDIIHDRSSSSTEIDTLILNNINPEDVRLSSESGGIVIRFTTSGEFITDLQSLTYGYGIDQITFGDGNIWSRADILYWAKEGSAFYGGTTGADQIIGSKYDQRLSGNLGADYIDGRGGSDIIFGDGGNDTLAVSVSMPGEIDQLDGGEGNDTVTFEEFSTSIFVDVVLNNGEARTSDSSSISTASDRLMATLINLENVVGTQFADHLLGNDAANKLSGNAGDDYLDGRSGNDVLSGGVGNDTLLGYLGDDTLQGGAGTDHLEGGAGNDTLEGGSGDDHLEGGSGNDTFVFAFGDGADVIVEADGEGTSDVLRLKGVQPSDVALSRSGSDLLIAVAGGAGGTLRLIGPVGAFRAYDQYGIEQILFDDGTSWDAAYLRQWSIYDSATDGDDTLVGTNASGNFGGGKGNDTLDGGRGNDTYYYSRGDGNDTITEGTNSGNADQIILVGFNPADVTLVRNGNHVTLAIAESAAGVGDAGSILIKEALNDFYDQGIEKIVFADGAVWTRNELRLMLLDQVMTAGDDIIAGFNVADIINAGAGNDTVNAGDGNDIITGGRGNDTIDGGRGNDTYYYSRGDGNDTITEGTNSGNADQIILVDINPADVTLVRNGNHVTLAIAESAAGVGDAGSILIKEALNDFYDQGADKIVFADGTFWTRAQLRGMVLEQAATSGNDTIVGFNVADTIAGGWGDDTLTGGAGNDVFVFKPNFGLDTITDFKAGSGAGDVLEFANTLFTDFEAVLAAASQVGSDTVIAFDAANTVTLKNVTLANLHADDVRFVA
ncbi:hypothetical protein I6F11_14935 [Ensifer sp. NBAIM29]|nr:hypothetical protein [Ensifer sp. NBAIM29]